MTAPDTAPRKNTLGAIAAGAGFGIAFVSAVAALLAGLGTRWGWWDFRTGFMILRFAVWAGLAAAAISLYAMFVAWRHGYQRAIVFGIHGLIIGALVFGVPCYLVNEGRKLPPIHDITTDTDDPPAFVAVLPLRKNAPNPAQYAGAELAAQQKQGYPGLAPLALPTSAARGIRPRARHRAPLGLGNRRRRAGGQPHRSDRHHRLVRIQGRYRDPHQARRHRQPRGHAIGVTRRAQRSRHQRAAHTRFPAPVERRQSRLAS